MERNNQVKDYKAVFCRSNKKYGIRKIGHEGWWIEPIYDDVCWRSEWRTHEIGGWVKNNGRYGYLNLETREEIIPCMYGNVLSGVNADSRHIVWKDYKAGLINGKNEVLIPFIYDDLCQRIQYVDNPNPTIVMRGDEEYILPHTKRKSIFKGYAGFTNEGANQAYDENCQPCEFEEWEYEFITPREQTWYIPENANRTVEEMEKIICDEYRILLSMGYKERSSCMTDEARKRLDQQEEKVKNYILDRRNTLDRQWDHNRENGQKIRRVNDLLMRAVAKAIKLGEKTSKSLQWMEKVPNSCEYYVETYVLPVWENDKSVYGYKPKKKNHKAENDRLLEQEYESEFHIWNIIAAMSGTGGGRKNGKELCFSKCESKYNRKDWDFCELVLDDGESWDDFFRYPAYMDCYFTVPFYYMCHYYYANSDYVQFNDFRVKVDVILEIKERDKK